MTAPALPRAGTLTRCLKLAAEAEAEARAAMVKAIALQAMLAELEADSQQPPEAVTG